MRNNRLVTVAVLVGVVITVVTFVGAARMMDEGKSAKDAPNIIAPVKAGSNGVVMYGFGGIDNGIDYLSLYPENLPQPSVVKRVLVSEGQMVKAGQPLIEFDTEHADLKLAEAQAGVAKAKAALEEAKSARDQAVRSDESHKLNVESQRITLKSKQAEIDAAEIELKDKKKKAELARVEKDPDLLIAAKKLLQANLSLDAERKKLEFLERVNPNPLLDVKRAEAGIGEAEAGVALQEAQLALVRYALKELTLRSRVGGKIIRSQVAEGMTFGMQTRQPAFLLLPNGQLIVRAEVDQEFASRVAVGQDAAIQDDGNPNIKWTGKVLRIADAFLPKRSNATVADGLVLNETRVLECIVAITGGDPKTPLRIGQRVRVSVGVE